MLPIASLPLDRIRRPLPRQPDPEKAIAPMESIAAEGWKEPLEVLEVDGRSRGFSGCYRHEAHRRLGRETIREAGPSRPERRVSQTSRA